MRANHRKRVQKQILYSSMAEYKSVQSDQITSKPSLSAKSVAQVKKIGENKNDISATRGTLVSKSTAPTFRAPKGRGCSKSRIRPRSAHVGLYACVVANQLIKCNLIESLFYVYTRISSIILCDLQNNFTM